MLQSEIGQPLEFRQKRWRTRTSFSFGEKELRHSVKDPSGEVDFAIDYGEVGSNKRTIFEGNNWLRNVGFLWTVIGLVQIVLAVTGIGEVRGSAFWFTIGLGCLAFYWFTRATYTVIETDEGNIWIVHDKQHDAIYDTLRQRRKASLLAWYRGTDYGDDRAAKVRAVDWLVKQDVLTKEEGRVEIADISDLKTLGQPVPLENVKKLH